MSGNSRSTGCGGIWRSMLGRSSVDPAPGVSTDPKRRFLGAVALRDRGRKLYPGPGGRGVGTSEAEADPKPSGWSMDEYLIRPLNYNKFLNLINFMERIYLLLPRRRITKMKGRPNCKSDQKEILMIIRTQCRRGWSGLQTPEIHVTVYCS